MPGLDPAADDAEGRIHEPAPGEKDERLIARVKDLPPTPTAVAHPCTGSALEGAVDAARMGIIAPVLVGPRAKIAIRDGRRERCDCLDSSFGSHRFRKDGHRYLGSSPSTGGRAGQRPHPAGVPQPSSENA